MYEKFKLLAIKKQHKQNILFKNVSLIRIFKKKKWFSETIFFENVLMTVWKVFFFYSYLLKSYIVFTFFCIHKKKTLVLRKFLTSGFWWIYMFWHIQNMIWSFLENVCLHVCLQNFVDTVSQEQFRGNWWNFIFSCTLI